MGGVGKAAAVRAAARAAAARAAARAAAAKAAVSRAATARRPRHGQQWRRQRRCDAARGCAAARGGGAARAVRRRRRQRHGSSAGGGGWTSGRSSGWTRRRRRGAAGEDGDRDGDAAHVGAHRMHYDRSAHAQRPPQRRRARQQPRKEDGRGGTAEHRRARLSASAAGWRWGPAGHSCRSTPIARAHRLRPRPGAARCPLAPTASRLLGPPGDAVGGSRAGRSSRPARRPAVSRDRRPWPAQAPPRAESAPGGAGGAVQTRGRLDTSGHPGESPRRAPPPPPRVQRRRSGLRWVRAQNTQF